MPLDDRLPPYVVHPDRGRDRLVRLPFVRVILLGMGLGEWLAPIEAPVEAKPPARVPANPVLILGSLPIAHGIGPQWNTTEALANHLPGHDGRGLSISSGYGLPQSNLGILSPPDRVGELSQFMRSHGAASVRPVYVGQGLLWPRPFASVDEALTFGAANDRTLSERLSALAYVGAHADEWAGLVERGEGIGVVANWLELARRLVETLRTVVDVDLRGQMGEVPRDVLAGYRREHPVTRNILRPFQEELAGILRRLVATDRPEARRLLLLYANAAGPAGLALLDRPLTPFAKTPSEDWFEWHSSRVRAAGDLPELLTNDEFKRAGWQSHEVLNGFRNLNVLRSSVEITRWTKDDHIRLTSLVDQAKALPLWSFGVKRDHRELQRRLIDFVITVDQRAGPALARLNENAHFARFASLLGTSPSEVPLLRRGWRDHDFDDERDVLADRRRRAAPTEPYDGLLGLTELIEDLAYPDYAFREVEGFSEDTYYANVIEVVTELLHDADDVLRTRGTHLALINLAVELDKMVSDRLKRQRDHLAEVVKDRLLLALSAVDRDDGSCGHLLGPDPLKHRLGRN